jgi:peroxiredoxin
MRLQHLRTPLLLLLLLLFTAALAGCNSQLQEPVVGTYRAQLELPGGAAPFGLKVERESDGYALYLSNGDEITRVPQVKFADGELFAVFPGYENSLRATMHRKRLAGAVTLIKAGGKEQVIPFSAELGQTHRFFKDAASDNADVQGRWQVTLTDDTGVASQAVAVFEQEHDRVTGTIMTPTGDHRFLDGQVRNDQLWLSTFAGGLAYLYKLQVNTNGELEGEYWQGLASHEKVRAQRNPQARLADDKRTSMKDGARFDFTFRDLDGKEVSLSDPQFRGKVVLVTLGGSWCPNCHDEARFLAPYYRENRARGFEIVALMFERHGQFDKAAAASRRFRDDMGIEYTVLVAGVSETEEASKALPGLTGIYGYPTALFIDKQGAVRKIHTGFTGPATGHHYDEYVLEFRAFVDQLLAE